MELKRILASDTRSANEIALKRYGPDVFVISNQRLAGQTELVVAVDVQAASALEEDLHPLPENAEPSESFTDQFQSIQKQWSGPTQRPISTERIENVESQNDREMIRSREIVASIRDEIAALRKEFRLNQKAQLWQGTHEWTPELQTLVKGLNEASVPTSLRTLLLDGLREQTHLSVAIDHLVQQLVNNITVRLEPAPAQGVHVLVGPSGAGKTTMLAKLARNALNSLSASQIAVISFRDQRAGAWPQMQMLCSTMGVDCYRAQDAQVLATVLNELSPRALILIDTSGVQMADNLMQCRQVCSEVQVHAVVPADVSTATLQRIMAGSDASWRSLMVSKLDESNAPWPLLQHLMTSSENLGLSVGGESEKLGDELLPLTPIVLAELAVAEWMPPKTMPMTMASVHSASNTEFH